MPKARLARVARRTVRGKRAAQKQAAAPAAAALAMAAAAAPLPRTKISVPECNSWASSSGSEGAGPIFRGVLFRPSAKGKIVFGRGDEERHDLLDELHDPPKADDHEVFIFGGHSFVHAKLRDGPQKHVAREVERHPRGSHCLHPVEDQNFSPRPESVARRCPRPPLSPAPAREGGIAADAKLS